MIKKTITVLTMLVLSTALIWAVWEGNAAVGVQEDFPAGLFVSSDVFPKYTLIEVTNLEQNTTSRAVIIDNTGAEGVLVKVSPDLAKALAIKEGSIVRVRVSVPPIVAEEGADPVLLGKVEKKQPLAPAPAKDTAVEEPRPIPPEETVQTEEQKLPYEDSAHKPAPVKEEASVQSEPAPQNEPIIPPREVTEPVQPLPAAEEKIADPLIVAEPVQSETEHKPEETILPITELSEPLQPEPKIISNPSTVDEVIEPAEQLVQSASSGEYERPVQEAAEIAVREEYGLVDTAGDTVPEVLPPAEPTVVYSAAPIKEIAPIEKTPAEDIVAAETTAVEEPETGADTGVEDTVDTQILLATEETIPEEDETKGEFVEKYAVLVPAEPRDPVREAVSSPKALEKPEIVPVITQPAQEPYTAGVLKKGSFYVQIGQFKDMLNAQSFVQRYGKQYPVTVEKSSVAKDVVYKVYIGPLKNDERGAALETFQKLGFKDAFLKKAP